MVYEDKIFQVREYKDFPRKMAFDPIARVCDTLEEASIRSIEMNRASHKRYYVQDMPHEDVVVSASLRESLKKRFGL
jgi:hypothetical protein